MLHAPDFSLHNRVAIITGGAGLLGIQHAIAIGRAGGLPVLADIRASEAQARAASVAKECGTPAIGIGCDITQRSSVEDMLESVLHATGRVDILINNAANNPKVESQRSAFNRLEQFSREQWHADLEVGLTGAFVCAQVVGGLLARQNRGVIINISSEYGLIAPDQRLYMEEGTAIDQQPVKPVTYSVVKAGLHGLTLYLATYWAQRGVRVNTISLGGVENDQPPLFLERAQARIPLGRMAKPHDFQGALIYLCSDASSFVTGANLVVDGGKTIW